MITFANGHTTPARANTAGSSFDVEASSIGIGPGEVVRTIVVTLAARGMEPEMPLEFTQATVEMVNGEIAALVYFSALGSFSLTVWND